MQSRYYLFFLWLMNYLGGSFRIKSSANFLTIGSKTRTEGKAIIQEIIHDESHRVKLNSDAPTLLKMLTNETIADMLNDKKKGTRMCMALGGSL